MSRYVTGLARNYTPTSARGNFDELLPSSILRSMWRTRPASTPLGHHRDCQGDERLDARHGVLGRGEARDHRPRDAQGYVGDQKTTDARESYAIGYLNINGRFAITRIAQVELPGNFKGDTSK